VDWATAIDRNRNALNAILATLFAMLELADGEMRQRITPALRSAVLRLLRPAEAAARRLVVIAARGLVVNLPPVRAVPAGLAAGKRSGRRPAFRLFDRRKRFVPFQGGSAVHGVPRIHVFAADPRVAALWQAPGPQAAPAPDHSVDATPLGRRLVALAMALEDLPRQARRLARWRARQERQSGRKPGSPLRPGRPPGYRRKPAHAVDEILIECHGLARDALSPDTS